MDIQQRQRDVILRILHLNEHADSAPGNSTGAGVGDGEAEERTDSDWEGVWKILIYDAHGRDILAPLMHVADLRRQGVTLHMPITSQRQPVPEVPAIYFVRPTESNMRLIARDYDKGLYEDFHINLSSSLSREHLESLAKAVNESSSRSRISRVFDQYCDFVSLEPRLFTLNHTSSFSMLNHSGASVDALMAYIDTIVEGLFCVLVTMGVVPVIRCPPGEAAETAAQKLNDRLREHLNNPHNLFVESNIDTMAFRRPVLLLLDRNVDLTAPLHHPWTYQALTHDLLELRSNRVTLLVSEKDSTGQEERRPKEYDLDPHDPFWSENAAKPFPKVAEAVEAALKEWQEAYSSIRSHGGDLEFDHESTTEHLANTITALPELQQKKRVLDMHTNIATAVLKQIKTRELDAYFSLEEDCITRADVDFKAVLNLLGPEAKGTVDDKLRLLMIYYLTHNVPKDALENMQRTLLGDAYDPQSEKLAPLTYLSKWKFANGVAATASGAAHPSSAASSAQPSESSLFSTITKHMYTTSRGILSGVKNLLPVSKDLPITKIVDAIMENKDNNVTERYRYFDPRSSKHAKAHRSASPFNDIIVFILGGGNYVEYHNLRQLHPRTVGGQQVARTVLYGCTELVSPTDFVAQLVDLGLERPPASARAGIGDEVGVD